MTMHLRDSRHCFVVAALTAAAVFWPGLSRNTIAQELEILHVQNNVYAIFGAGGNIAVQVGPQGPVIVDSGLDGRSDDIMQAIATISDRPVRDIVNTHIHPDHIGGNEAIASSGGFASGGTTGAGRRDATMYAHENVLLRMSGALGDDEPVPTGQWPGNTYFTASKELFVNGEAIQILHQPRAHTDGDSIVFFRRSDVIAAGDVYVNNGYPIIDRARGGTVNGLIAALNNILDIVIPAPTQERGTMVIPGHGRIADEHDVLEYRDMVVIVRDRIQSMIDDGLTLAQVQQANPTFEYDPRYGADSGFWTTGDFVEAVYLSLSED